MPEDKTPPTADEVKKEKKEKTPRISKFAALYPDDMKVTLLVKENPKKEGSKARARFEGYFGAATIGAARKGGVGYSDLAYDVGRGHIKVG